MLICPPSVRFDRHVYDDRWGFSSGRKTGRERGTAARNSRLILSSIRADSCYVRTESTPDSDFIDGVVVVVWRSSPPRHAPFTTIDLPLAEHDIIGRLSPPDICPPYLTLGWLGSRVVSVLDSGAEGPGLKSQSRRCRVAVLGKLFTPIVPLFTKQQNW